MSDYTASRIEDQIKELAEFVHGEADIATKSIRSQLIVLVVVLVVLGIYGVILNKIIDEATEPQTVATTVAVLVDANMPDIAGTIEQVLDSATPEIADFISNKVLKEGVPFMVGKAEGFLLGYVDTMTKETAGHMDTAFNDVIAESKDSLGEAIDNPQTGDDPSQALRPLRDKLHASFVDQTTGKKTEAGESIAKSLIALRNLNRKLGNLAAADPAKMGKSEAMGAKLLKTYWQYMHHTKAQDAGVEDDEQDAAPVGGEE